MTHSDIKTKFLIEYDKANITSSYPSLTDYEIATLLDKAYYALINQKVTGNNPRQAGFESDNKAIEDIQPLIVTKLIPKVAEHSHVENDVTYNIPSDYLYYVQSKMKVGYNVNGQTTYSSTDVELVSHELAKKYMCTTHNKPWVEVPVCYIEDNEITALTDPILHTPGDLDLTYIKQFKKFAFHIDPSEEPDPSTDPDVDPTDDPTIDPDTEDIVWSITINNKSTTFYNKTNTAEIQVVCINNKGELGTYKSYINEADNEGGYITKVSEDKFTINSVAADYCSVGITFVCDQDTNKTASGQFLFKYYSDSVTPTPVVSTDYVDIGLSVKWGKYNIGASGTDQYGGYYGWGDPTGEVVSHYTNKYAVGNTSSSISGNPKYDIATAKLGSGWRMPTKAEFEEMIAASVDKTWTYDDSNGIRKQIATFPNGNTLEFPCAGYMNSSRTEKLDDLEGYYWTADINTKDTTQAQFFHIYGSQVRTFFNAEKYMHLMVRPVYDGQVSPQPSTIQYVDMGLSVLWADRNVGANSNDPRVYGTYFKDADIPAGYRLPTIGEVLELLNNTNHSNDTPNTEEANVVYGTRFRKKNDDSVYIDLAPSGMYTRGEANLVGSRPYMWTSSKNRWAENSSLYRCYYKTGAFGNIGDYSFGNTFEIPIRLVREKQLNVNNALATYHAYGFDDNVAPNGISFSDSEEEKPWQCYNKLIIFPTTLVEASEFYTNPDVQVTINKYNDSSLVLTGHLENVENPKDYSPVVQSGANTALIFVPDEPVTEDTFDLGTQYSVIIPQGAYKNKNGINPRTLITYKIV